MRKNKRLCDHSTLKSVFDVLNATLTNRIDRLLISTVTYKFIRFLLHKLLFICSRRYGVRCGQYINSFSSLLLVWLLLLLPIFMWMSYFFDFYDYRFNYEFFQMECLIIERNLTLLKIYIRSRYFLTNRNRSSYSKFFR